jgi:uncharacterized membrane protein
MSHKRSSFKNSGIIFVAASTIIIALGQIMLKAGTYALNFSLRGIFLNFWLISGIILYLAATILLLIGLKRGELSTLYPLLGLGYIWVCILSFFIFKETITLLNGFGILFIILGVGLLGVRQNG